MPRKKPQPDDVGDELKIAVALALQKFRLDDDQAELEFPSSLTADERLYIHRLALEAGLKSKSRGRAAQRYLTVYKEHGSTIVQADAVFQLSRSSRHSVTTMLSKYPVTSRERQDLLPPSERDRLPLDLRDLARATGRLNTGVPQVPPPCSPIGGGGGSTTAQLSLPIHMHADELLHTISLHPVCVVGWPAGAGGCTSQLPLLLLDHHCAIGRPLRAVCVTPHRLTALANAERVAAVREEPLGHTVGYQVQLESRVSPKTLLTFCTAGVLLRTLMAGGCGAVGVGASSGVVGGGAAGAGCAGADAALSMLTHVIVDQLQERDRHVDFLLCVLRDALLRYRQLKLILVTACDAAVFVKYFHGCASVMIGERCGEVQHRFLDDLLAEVRYDTTHMRSMRAMCRTADSVLPAWISALVASAAAGAAAAGGDVTNGRQSVTDGKPMLDGQTAAGSNPRQPDNDSGDGDVDPAKAALMQQIDAAMWEAWRGGAEEACGRAVPLLLRLKNIDHRHRLSSLSLLMVAAARGHVLLLHKLLTLGASCRLRAANGWTAGQWARQLQQTRAAQLLAAWEGDLTGVECDMSVALSADCGRAQLGSCGTAAATTTQSSDTGQVDDARDRLRSYQLSADESCVDVDLVTAVLRHVLTRQTAAHQVTVLVFLPDYDSIVQVRTALYDTDWLHCVGNHSASHHQHQHQHHQQHQQQQESSTAAAGGGGGGGVGEGGGGDDDAQSLINAVVVALHADMSSCELRRVLVPVSGGGSGGGGGPQHKVVLATHIGQWSVTVEDASVVIDCCRRREPWAGDRLSWISRACVAQRGQRATLAAVTRTSRWRHSCWTTSPPSSSSSSLQMVGAASSLSSTASSAAVLSGTCYHLMSRAQLTALAPSCRAQLPHAPPHLLCLYTKLLAPPHAPIADYLARAIEPPAYPVSRAAVHQLKCMDALDIWEDLSELGHHLLALPIEPRLAKSLVLAVVLKCLDPVLTVVCCLSVGGVGGLVGSWSADSGSSGAGSGGGGCCSSVAADASHSIFCTAAATERRPVCEARRKLAANALSDHMVVLRAFQMWQRARAEGWERQFCRQHCASGARLELATVLRSQLLGQLRALGFVRARGAGDIRDLNSHSENWAVVKAALCGGAYPQLARVDRDHRQVRTQRHSSATFATASVLAPDTAPVAGSSDSGGVAGGPQDAGRAHQQAVTCLPVDWLLYEQCGCGVSGWRSATLHCVTAVTPLCVALMAGPMRLPLEAVTEADAVLRGMRGDALLEEDSDSESELLLATAAAAATAANGGANGAIATPAVTTTSNPSPAVASNINGSGSSSGGGNSVSLASGDSQRTLLKIDEWLWFAVDADAAHLTLQLRQKWHALLVRRLRAPGRAWTPADEAVLRALVTVLSGEEQSAGLQQPVGIGQRPRPMATTSSSSSSSGSGDGIGDTPATAASLTPSPPQHQQQLSLSSISALHHHHHHHHHHLHQPLACGVSDDALSVELGAAHTRFFVLKLASSRAAADLVAPPQVPGDALSEWCRACQLLRDGHTVFVVVCVAAVAAAAATTTASSVSAIAAAAAGGSGGGGGFVLYGLARLLLLPSNALSESASAVPAAVGGCGGGVGGGVGGVGGAGGEGRLSWLRRGEVPYHRVAHLLAALADCRRMHELHPQLGIALCRLWLTGVTGGALDSMPPDHLAVSRGPSVPVYQGRAIRGKQYVTPMVAQYPRSYNPHRH